MMIELRHLRYFIAVAEELHFGRAAQRLHISQPPLSQQILQLEQALDAQLFTRTNRSVQLTPAGQSFLQDARAVLLQVEQAAGRAARIHHGQQGELRIGFTSSAPFTGLVSDALYHYRQRWPEVHIQMQEYNTRQQLAPLHEGDSIWASCAIRRCRRIFSTACCCVNRCARWCTTRIRWHRPRQLASGR